MRDLRLPGGDLAVPVVVAAGAAVTALLLAGPTAAAQVLLLSIVEVSLSVDNAVVNATVLRRLSPFWQKLFVTLGVLIAVVGMRLLFPLLVVAATARISPIAALRLATNDPHGYSLRLLDARPQIAAFGGVFLLMVFLDFALAEHDIHWLAPIERVSARIGRLDRSGPVIALVGLLAVAEIGGHRSSDAALRVLAAGVLGLITHLFISGLNDLSETETDDEGEGEGEGGGHGHGDGDGGGQDDEVGSGVLLATRATVRPALLLTGRAAFTAFCFLELMDASFSFDGVIGAFAFTTNLLVIAAGLGVGALAVRTLTLRLVRQGTLARYAYLEHGAHYAIGALGALLLAGVYHPLPDLATGLTGAAFITAALVSSVVRNRRAEQPARTENFPQPVGAAGCDGRG